jgi:hypothetical protein
LSKPGSTFAYATRKKILKKRVTIDFIKEGL